MTNPELKVVTVPRLYNEIPTANPQEHPSRDVLQTLEELGTTKHPVVESQDHLVIPGPALTPQRPNPEPSFDKVLWFATKNERRIELPWEMKYLHKLAEDDTLWNNFDNWLEKKREPHPQLRFFILLGHPHPNYDWPKEIFPQGMQTLPPRHGHITSTINLRETEKNRIHDLDSSNETHAFLLNTFLVTGRESLEILTKEHDLVTPKINTLNQKLQILEEEVIVQRPYFAFENLSSAVKASVEIIEQVEIGWVKHALELAKMEKVLIPGLMLFLKQSCVPNMTILQINGEDQKSLGLEQKLNTLVFPFSLTNPQSILDNVLLIR